MDSEAVDNNNSLVMIDVYKYRQVPAGVFIYLRRRYFSNDKNGQNGKMYIMRVRCIPMMRDRESEGLEAHAGEC